MEAEHINSIANQLEDLAQRAAELRGIFDYDHKRERLNLLNQEMEDPKIWDDAKRAQELGREKKTLEDVVLDCLTVARIHPQAPRARVSEERKSR